MLAVTVLLLVVLVGLDHFEILKLQPALQILIVPEQQKIHGMDRVLSLNLERYALPEIHVPAWFNM